MDTLPLLTDDYEVIVINDGSTDETSAVLDELARTFRHMRIIHHPRNLGYGAALRSGFRHASKDLIFYTDGDGQYDVRDLVKLHPLLDEGVDVVNGFKIKRADQTHRKVFGEVYKSLARFLYQLPIRDVDCDFRLLRRQALQQIDLVSSSGIICVELVRKLHVAGCTFVETPVQHHPRAHGRSQFFTLRRVGRTMLDFSALWWRLVLLRNLSPDTTVPKEEIQDLSA